MNFSSDLSNSEEYKSFRASVPLKKVAVDEDSSKMWKIYDAGPKTVSCPLVCLAPVSGTADVFFKQMLYLTARGIRVISVESPVYWTILDWCMGFRRLLDNLDIDKVHIFGSSLGGFLAQKFAEYSCQYSRVASIILCNSFLDTSIFSLGDTANMLWFLPGPILKKLVVGNIKSEMTNDLRIKQATEFMIERVDSLSQQELASRLTLNCVKCSVNTENLKRINITILDVFDGSALSSETREKLSSKYQQAKVAHLKAGGNFPYLSRPDDVNIHLLVHLRQFSASRHTAEKPDSLSRTSLDWEINTSANKSDTYSDTELGTEAN